MELSTLDAIYSAEVTLNDSKFGNAIFVFNQGAIHGADSAFVYKGSYAVVQDSVSAAVVVDRYSGEPCIGLPTHFRLVLNIAAANNGLTLVSTVDGKSEKGIRFELKKISKLDDH